MKQHYITTTSRKTLRLALKEGATKYAARDLGIANEWLNLDEEAWQNSKK
ncbi:MAG: hypothetical protein HC916_05035 [Coleofasciculaceae cyanobacterium SM2_1_6]|nr:hypothetical protein [Coleofasciculaceae cyanobacterium SM2_1_6]